MASCPLCSFEAEDGEVRSAEDRVSDHINGAHPDVDCCSKCEEWHDWAIDNKCESCYVDVCDNCYSKSCDSCNNIWHEDCAPDFGSMNGNHYCENCITELGGQLNEHFRSQSEHGHGGWE